MAETNGTRTIAVTSGKGGVGKTTLSVNLALALAEEGYRSCLFDADLGLANVNVLLGLDVARTLEDALFGETTLQDIRFRDVHGIDIIPGSSGARRMADLDPEQVSALLSSFGDLDGYDFFIMDTSAGIARNVVAFCLAAHDVILVVAPEPASMTDAYALLKILHLNDFQGRVEVVVSRCRSIAAAKTFFDRFRVTVREHLNLKVVLLGVVVQDDRVQDAVRRRQPVLRIHPRTNASRCIRHLAKALVQRPVSGKSPGLSPFWERFIRFVKAPLNLGEEEAGPPQPEQEAATAPGGRPRIHGSGIDLSVQLNAVTHELSLIREALVKMSSNGGEGRKHEPIRLDFDAFLEQRSAITKRNRP
ncbi:MAG: MinD/ParA family protein [Deltaproteobacteria bacterium]|nr:MinD/ParA family protein [Deltaproteobacteria bacterium]